MVLIVSFTATMKNSGMPIDSSQEGLVPSNGANISNGIQGKTSKRSSKKAPPDKAVVDQSLASAAEASVTDAQAFMSGILIPLDNAKQDCIDTVVEAFEDFAPGVVNGVVERLGGHRANPDAFRILAESLNHLVIPGVQRRQGVGMD